MTNIITLDEYRDFDDLPSPAENETQVNIAILSATAYIEKETGRVFELAGAPSPSDTVEILDGKGTSRLFTHQAPVTAVSKLEYWDGTAWQEYDIVSVPYLFKANSNIVYFTQGHRFLDGYQNTRVTFEYGYDTVLPTDLKIACYQLAKFFVTEAERQGINRQADGDQTFWYTHTLPENAVKTVRLYKTVW